MYENSVYEIPCSRPSNRVRTESRVIIALTGGTMNIVIQGGKTETHQWETGKAYWLPANPPGEMHTDVNAGDKPIEVMVVELKTAR